MNDVCCDQELKVNKKNVPHNGKFGVWGVDVALAPGVTHLIKHFWLPSGALSLQVPQRHFA